MLEIIDLQNENILGFRVDGRIEKEDVQKVFAVLEEKAAGDKKMKMFAEIENFHLSDISAEAVKEDIKLWFRNLGILPNIEKAAVVTDSNWIEKAFKLEVALIPTLEGESFSTGEKDLAIEWLETDQRESNRLDLTFSELTEISTLKFAGGFALGFLTAGLFSGKQRKTIGTVVMFGAVASGIPLALKVLNNNRRLCSSGANKYS